jgi:hypothetical protein
MMTKKKDVAKSKDSKSKEEEKTQRSDRMVTADIICSVSENLEDLKIELEKELARLGTVIDFMRKQELREAQSKVPKENLAYVR